ncbi:hypothetical protein PN498_15655, partial [Oscillatoria sp. CS-180]|uniref:LamG-like jellyroll fold domain-containing protein n=1 Tax=Oscillatoria sp. CS-180 TaxID=3021720 RepID=UPI002FEE216C|nr:hypothetical protein [Oscillatoria sp. CS-180]
GGSNNVFKLGLRTTEGVVEYESAADVQTTDWQQVVMTWQSGSPVQFYIDGELDNPTAAVPALGGSISGVTDLFLGRGQKVSTSWDGLIDDFRIYGRALDADEVAQLYEDNLIEDNSPLSATLSNTSIQRQEKTGIIGSPDNDTLIGDAQANVFQGLAGNDVLTGNGGADEFIHDTRLGGVDQITDFDADDRVRLLATDLAVDFTNGFSFISDVDPRATSTKFTVLYDSNSGSLSYDPDGIGAASQIDFIQLDGAPNLAVNQLVVT